MTDMRSNFVRKYQVNARLAQIGAALAIAQIAAAIWIGVAVARRHELEPIDYDRMTRPHAEAAPHFAVARAGGLAAAR